MKFKRRRLRRLRARAIKKFKVNRVYLEKYERQVIMADVHRMDARICVSELMSYAPGRYNRTYLAKALIRLSKDGYLTRGRQERIGFSRRQTIYRLPERKSDERKAA